MFALELVMWIFLRSKGVICHDRWVLSEGHENYFKKCCLVNSQPASLFLKVVPATFLLVCFVCLKDSPFETRKFLFLFHFESSVRSWDNQIMPFQIFEYHDVIKCLSMKHETWTYEVNTVSWWNLASLCNITKENFSLKNFMKNVAWKLVPDPIWIFKESSVKRNLRRPMCRFGQFLIVLLIHI